MATHGTLSPFESSREDWGSYTLRMKYYFDANGITEANKQKSILLSACGPATFRRICSLLTPAQLEVITYDDLVREVTSFYDPKPSLIMQRYQFNSRVRASGESIASYVAALRKLTEHCSYGDAMEEMIRDRLVCGVNHDGIQQRLLSEKNLSFKNAFDLAQAIEAAEKNNKILKNSSANSPELHYSSSGLPVVEGAKRLAARKVLQNVTGVGDHILPQCATEVCRSKSDITIAKPNPGHKKNLYMQDDQVDHDGVQECVQASVQDSYGMFPVCTTSCQPMVLDVSINRIHADMELDTGASLSILSEKTY